MRLWRQNILRAFTAVMILALLYALYEPARWTWREFLGINQLERRLRTIEQTVFPILNQ